MPPSAVAEPTAAPSSLLPEETGRYRVGGLLGGEGARAEGQLVAPNGEAYDHRFIASTERLATDGGVIPVEAWRLEGFMRRPRFLAQHDRFGLLTSVAIGRVVYVAVENGLPVDRVGPSGRALVAYVRYASTAVAQDVRRLYDEGILDDVSVSWDWRTEKLRAPYEEEIAVHGDGLRWVGEETHLQELSAVVLGADPGAQQVRSLDEVVARCRAEGRPLEGIERVLRQRMDEAAIGDAVTQLDEALGKLDGWLDGVGPIRSILADAIVAIRNLMLVAQPEAEGNDTGDGAVDGDDRAVGARPPVPAEAVEDAVANGVKGNKSGGKKASGAVDDEAAQEEEALPLPESVATHSDNAAPTDPMVVVEELIAELRALTAELVRRGRGGEGAEAAAGAAEPVEPAAEAPAAEEPAVEQPEGEDGGQTAGDFDELEAMLSGMETRG